MLHLRDVAVISACVLMLGCSAVTNRHPKLTYADKHHPLSDTAIFSCFDAPGIKCGIASVDYNSTWNYYNGGKTLWVRVLPGAHHIGVVAENNRVINWLSFDVKDVQPSHAYAIAIESKNGAMSVSYTDLGKMDAYTVHVDPHGLHPAKLTASF